jgi:glutaminyl-tRNA synthetase
MADAAAPHTADASPDAPAEPSNFIRAVIERDLETGRYGDRVVTRFPPEPNGYPHIGHAKSIVLNFGIRDDYAARGLATRCHLRFDDTNPETEDMEYVRAMQDAIRWLGYEWDALYYASDYFEPFYAYAVTLIKKGLAYVDSLSAEEIRAYRGTVSEPGRPSPYRDRSVEENLDLFARMKAGEFEEGAHVLRAKIDMASPHMILRDPLLFRIRHAEHYRRGTAWCIYPMYDFAHPLEDAIEDVTHSLCTLEFDNNRKVYDWVLEHALPSDEVPTRPRQYEFARLNLGYTIMSKRKLLRLVERGDVAGWDDPRMPTIAGFRRRGVTPEAIRTFCEGVGVTRTNSRIEMSQLEHAIRDDLNTRAPRVMAVTDPLRVVVTNWPEGKVEHREADDWPREIDKAGTRTVPFTRELYIERDDFREDPPEGFYRLAPGREVRLRHGYFLTCDAVIHDDRGRVAELRGTVDLATGDGTAPDGRSPKGTLHWVSATEGVPALVRLYDRLFTVPDPDARQGEDGSPEDFTAFLNPDSLVETQGVVEPSLAERPADERVQFERVGYFWQDPEDSRPGALVYNQIVPLRDRWAEREAEAERADMEAKRRAKEEAKRRQKARSVAAQRAPGEALTGEARARFQRYTDDLGLARDDAAVLADDAALAAFFEAALDTYDAPQPVANWVVNDLRRVAKDTPLDDLPFGPAELAALVRMQEAGVVSSRGAREVFDVLAAEGGAPEAIVDAKALRQLDDTEALAAVADEVLAAHPDEAARYRAGETKLIGFFMGQVMRATQGAANPELARQMLQERLASGD